MSKRPTTKRPPAPSLSFAQWRAQAAERLEKSYQVNAGIIPHRVWRNLYISNLSPEDAAQQADVSAYNVRLAFERVRGRGSKPRDGS
jgi:hypothetical protein